MLIELHGAHVGLDRFGLSVPVAAGEHQPQVGQDVRFHVDNVAYGLSDVDLDVPRCRSKGMCIEDPEFWPTQRCIDVIALAVLERLLLSLLLVRE